MRNTDLDRIFSKYSDMLFRIAFTHMKNHGDAEDMRQEVFVRMMRNRPVFNSEEHEKAWLIRTVINLCKDHEKSAWNRKTVRLEEVAEAEKQYLKIPYIETDDTLWAVLKLPEKYRNPLYLFYYEDYSVKEIAIMLGEQENTVKTRLRRGRERLKGFLTESI